MKKQLFWQILLLLFLSSCTRNTEPPTKIPDEIHKRIIFSEPCGLLSFSTNHDDYFTTSIITGLKNKTPDKKQLVFPFAANTYPQSISCDCQSISLIKEDHQKRGYQLLIYNLSSQETRLLSDTIGDDGGYSAFSPAKNILGYLSDHKPYLYYVAEDKKVQIDPPKNVDFKNLVWSVKGNFLFLEDFAGDIWRFDIKKKILKILWESPSETAILDRLITPSLDDESTIFFLSDHESEFNQIYKYSARNNTERFVISKFDKSLFKRPVSEENFYFRVNKDGCYIVQKRVNDHSENIGPEDGVVYDYIYENDSTELFLYSLPEVPASIQLRRSGKFSNLTGWGPISNAPVPEVVINKEGMHHLIFRPVKKTRGWLVWLHGGPFEQVSKRFNSYIVNLVNSGWGVIALNYPGSTGVGNTYELRLKTDLLSKQIAVIRRDMIDIMAEYKFHRYGLIGISYGSIVANELANRYSSEILSVSEISGLNVKPYPENLPTLFIYGEFDYALQRPERRMMLDSESKKRSVSPLILQNEGHTISRKTSHVQTIDKLKSFLNQ